MSAQPQPIETPIVPEFREPVEEKLPSEELPDTDLAADTTATTEPVSTE